ncbi:unnamed protein product, partial [Closterium sp. NIES-54]
MLALCREHRLEHRTKHIALRYFLARELQQRGQLRLAYVASEANTADIFTKALAPGDHQRFCTLLDAASPTTHSLNVLSSHSTLQPRGEQNRQQHSSVVGPDSSAPPPDSSAPPQVMCIRQLSLLLPLTVALLATPVCSTSGTPRRQLRKAQPAVTPNATLVLLANNTFGAKCLDGSPPGYYFRPGAAAGRLRWHIYLPGGAWCVTPADCSARAGTRLGSSKSFPANPAHYVRLPDSASRAGSICVAACQTVGLRLCWAPIIRGRSNTFPAAQLRPPFEGILSGSAQQNPAMYQWNLVRLIYCDGGGYAGTRGALNVSAAPAPPNASAAANSTSPSNSTKSTGSTKSSASTTSAIYLDGWNIIQAVIQDLVQKHEMRSASQILLSGSSAGGQATVNLCDWLASSFPSASTRCLVDSGFFL